jgi:hypothetical protein
MENRRIGMKLYEEGERPGEEVPDEPPVDGGSNNSTDNSTDPIVREEEDPPLVNITLPISKPKHTTSLSSKLQDPSRFSTFFFYLMMIVLLVCLCCLCAFVAYDKKHPNEVPRGKGFLFKSVDPKIGAKG